MVFFKRLQHSASLCAGRYAYLRAALLNRTVLLPLMRRGGPRPPGRQLLETPFAAFHSIYEDLIQISQTGGSDQFSFYIIIKYRTMDLPDFFPGAPIIFYIIIKYRTMDLPDFFPGAPIMPRGRPFPASRRRDCRKKDFFPTGQNM